MIKDKKFYFLVIVVLLVIAGLFFAWRIFYFQPEVNYLISGVPYNGIYNLFSQNADSTRISSVMDILGYWGDERFKLSDIKDKFPVNKPVYSQELKKFFEDNGYETYRWTVFEAGGELRQVKKFVNEKKKIPVMVFQRFAVQPGIDVAGYRVVIGIFDQDKKVAVHDHYLGNNYEISYDNFEKMFANDARVILAVWPGEKLKETIKGPDYSRPYPPRTRAMDETGGILISGRGQGLKYFSKDDKKIKELGLEIFGYFVNDLKFAQFPLAFRLSSLALWAQMNLALEKPDEAIRIINESVLPYNKNVNQQAEAGWVLPNHGQLLYPYIVLSRAYLKKGQKDLAIANYNEAKKIADAINLAEEGRRQYFGELKKELSL